MADQPSILRTFSDNWVRRIMCAVEAWERQFNATSGRRRRTPVGDGGSSTDGGGGGGTGGSGCCCSESDCVEVPGVADADLIPAYLYFSGGSFCGCTGGDLSDGQTRLYNTGDPGEDSGVWETKHGEDDEGRLMCKYPNCTATSEWTWPADAAITDTPGEAWVLASTSGGSCGVPARPDYDGPEGEAAQATTKFEPAPEVSFWTASASGMTFTIGETVVASYVIDSPRPFCRNCTNTFRLVTCERIKCAGRIPSTICLQPTMGGQTIRCESAGWEVDLPPVLNAGFSLHDCDCAFPPDVLHMTLGGPGELGSGIVASWQSPAVDWCNADCVAEGDCHERYVHGLTNVVFPVSIRFLLLSGGNGCFSTKIYVQVHLGTGYGLSDGISTIQIDGPAINKPEDILKLSASGDFDRAGYPGVGADGPPGSYPFCGWIKAPSSTWEGGFHTYPAYPDHYASVNISVPED